MPRNHLDDLLSEFGNPGKCQILYGVIVCYISIQWLMVQIFTVVVSYVPTHYCKTLDLSNSSSKDACMMYSYPLNRSEEKIPCTNGWIYETLRGEIYPSNEINSNFNLSHTYITNEACSIYYYHLNGSEEKVSCQNGWVYETLRGEIYPSNEFDLVCDREYLFRLALTVPYIGVMVGSLVLGFLSDKYGRKRILVFILPSLSALTLGCAFSPNLTTFIVLQFFCGFFAQGIQTINATYTSELFRRKTRTIVAYITAFLSAVLLPIQMYIMYFFLSWRTLLLIHGTLMVISTVLSWFLPESVTWLISKNKLEKAKKILEKFAKVNKLPIPTTLNTDLIEQGKEVENKQSKSSIQNYRLLLCHSSLTRVTLSIMYMMFVQNMVISGLSFSISALDGNVYTNYLINAVLQIVVLAIFLALFNRFGRVKIFILLFTSIGLLSSGGYILVYYSKNWHQAIKTIALFMALLSRNLTAASTAMLSTYASELLPIFLRSTGIGLGYMASRLGNTLTPQILYTLNHVWVPLPQTLYGMLMLISAVVIWFLPETFNKFMPRTLKDVDIMMGKSIDEEKKPLLLETENSTSKRDYQSCRNDTKTCDKELGRED